jgi:hypothetical protein
MGPILKVPWAIFGPIVVWPGYESPDAIPKDIKDDIRMARLALNAKCPGHEEATDVEVVAYLMTASLAQPLSADWTYIYIHVFCRYLEEKGIEPPASIKEEDRELNDYQKGMLSDLKAWLFKKSMESVKAKLKETKREPVHRNHSEDARGFSHGRNRGDTGGIPDPKSPSL